MGDDRLGDSRQWAGTRSGALRECVHWRSDAYESLRLGQKVAISILQEQTKIHNEANPYYIFRGFDGERIVVRQGGVFNSV